MKNEVNENTIELMIYGERARFTDPAFGVGGEKCSYQIPTYEALKGILKLIYWKPTFDWVIDSVRIMNPIQFEAQGERTIRYNGGGSDIGYNTYLRDCCYQVRAHFEWNENRPEFADDRDEKKHRAIAKRHLRKGGNINPYFGVSNCPAYVEPCRYGEGKSFYEDVPSLSFGLMYHGFTYPDEAYSEETKDKLTINFWRPVMKNGEIVFLTPKDCPLHRTVRPMKARKFENRKAAEKGV